MKGFKLIKDEVVTTSETNSTDVEFNGETYTVAITKKKVLSMDGKEIEDETYTIDFISDNVSNLSSFDLERLYKYIIQIRKNGK